MKELKEIIIDDNIFFINGIKGFIKDYEKEIEDIYLKENVKKIYESKKDTIKYIRDKRKEYKGKILFIENSHAIFFFKFCFLQRFLHIRFHHLQQLLLKLSYLKYF